MGATILPNRTKFSKVNLEDDPEAPQSDVKEVEQCAICPLWSMQGTDKVS